MKQILLLSLLMALAGCKSCKTSSEQAQPIEEQTTKPVAVPHINDKLKAEKIDTTTEQTPETEQQ